MPFRYRSICRMFGYNLCLFLFDFSHASLHLWEPSRYQQNCIDPILRKLVHLPGADNRPTRLYIDRICYIHGQKFLVTRSPFEGQAQKGIIYFFRCRFPCWIIIAWVRAVIHAQKFPLSFSIEVLAIPFTSAAVQ